MKWHPKTGAIFNALTFVDTARIIKMSFMPVMGQATYTQPEL